MTPIHNELGLIKHVGSGQRHYSPLSIWHHFRTLRKKRKRKENPDSRNSPSTIWRTLAYLVRGNQCDVKDKALSQLETKLV